MGKKTKGNSKVSCADIKHICTQHHSLLEHNKAIKTRKKPNKKHMQTRTHTEIFQGD